MNMEVEQTNPSSHNEDQTGDNDGGNWRRRLRLRKSSALSHTVKSTIEEPTVFKELNKEPSQNEQKDHQVVDTTSSKLTFTCSNCKDGTIFSADGLLKHFKNFHGEKGHPLSFPCDMCSFVASDFTTLQQHYQKHSRLTCETCNDKGLQMPSHLTKHCKTHNNQYQCEKLIPHFLQNSIPYSTVPAVDCSQKSGAKPMNGELNRSLLADAAGEPQKDALLKHVSTACNRGWSRRNWWKNRAIVPKQPNHAAQDVEFLIPKSEIQWTSPKFLPFSAAGLLDENGKLLPPTQTLEETKQFLETTVNPGKKWPMTLKGEQDLLSLSCPGPFLSEAEMKRCVTPLTVLNSGNELSGLMEKNNISLPPDCTTKVVGFKMVDGKKHLVLKVIPSANTEVSLDTGKEPAGLNQEERNDIQLDLHIERPSYQMCSDSGSMTTADSAISSYDATSTSHPPKKQGLGEEKDQGTIGDAPEADNENDCIDDQCAFSESPAAPAQCTLSGTEEVFNVVSQTKNEKPGSPEVMFNSNDTNDLSGENPDVPRGVCSVRQADIQTLPTAIQEISDTPKHTDYQEKAARDYEEMNSEPSTSRDDVSCVEDLSAGTSSVFGSTQEETNSQLITLMSEKGTSPDIYMTNMDKNSGDEEAIIQSSPNSWHEQKMENILNPSTNKDRSAMVESNIIDPTVASPHKNSTDSLFISSSEQGSLFFQDSGDELTSNIDPRYAQVPLDQNSTMESVEEPYSLLLLKDSCHKPDIYKTLEELPVTTVSHLLDDSEVTYRGTTSESEPGTMATQQVGMYSPKAIPVAAETNDKTTSQLPLMIEPAICRSRPREATTKDSQGHISKSKRGLVRNSQENKSSASVRYWEPPAPEIERTLHLFPVRSSQPVKVPRLNQPVVVLNHPDMDIPEVANIMRSVHRHNGAVQRVILSQGTLKALSELTYDTFHNIHAGKLQVSHYRRVWPKGTVKERFILNLRLKRLGRNKFKVASSNANPLQASFRCWFCGRHFRNQEVWVGHGQRHIMEATRDWNKLFNSEGQGNDADQQSYY